MTIKLYIVKGIIKFNNKYLLLKKVKDEITPKNKGKWEAPGGRIEENETPEQAIVREIKEETKLNCEIIKELPLLNIKKENFESKCHVFLINVKTDKVILSKEHSEFVWATIEEIKKMELVLFADLLLKYLNQVED